MRGVDAVRQEISRLPDRRFHVPSVALRYFDPASARGHYRVQRDPAGLPEGWWHRRVGDLDVAGDSNLPVAEITAPEGGLVALILGWALPLRSPLTPLPPLTASSAETFENWLYTLTGRFSAIYVGPGGPRLYVDSHASLPALFCQEHHIVASALPLIPEEDTCGDDEGLIAAMDLNHHNGSYRFGTTARRSVGAILPNHYLDLDSWTPHRHWPKEPPGETTSAEAITTITDAISAIVEAVTAATPVLLGLTAGYHSRLLLACARRVLDRVTCFTVAFPDRLGAIDVAVAPRLAEDTGIDHRLLPWIEPEPEDVASWFARTSCMWGDRRAPQGGPSYQQTGGGRPLFQALDPLFGRPARSFPGDDATTQLDATGLTARLRLPEHPRLLAAADRWLGQVPQALDTHQTLYLASTELASGGTLTFSYPGAYTTMIFPLYHRRIMDRMLALPPSYRGKPAFVRDAIAARWPELLRHPINARPGMTAFYDRSRRRVKHQLISVRRRLRRATRRRGQEPS